MLFFLVVVLPVLIGFAAVAVLGPRRTDESERVVAAVVGVVMAWTSSGFVALVLFTIASPGGLGFQYACGMFMYALLGFLMQVRPAIFRRLRHVGLSEGMRARIDDPAAAEHVKRGMKLAGTYSALIAVYLFLGLTGRL